MAAGWKRYVAILVAGVLAVVLVACASDGEASSTDSYEFISEPVDIESRDSPDDQRSRIQTESSQSVSQSDLPAVSMESSEDEASLSAPAPIEFPSHDKMIELLSTPIAELNQQYGITEQDKTLWMMGITSPVPELGVSFNYGGDETAELLNSIILFDPGQHPEELSTEYPFGYAIDEVLTLPKWSGAELNFMRYATGYSGPDSSLIPELTLEEDGLCWHLRTAYSNAFLPEDEQDLTIALIVIERVENEHGYY